MLQASLAEYAARQSHTLKVKRSRGRASHRAQYFNWFYSVAVSTSTSEVETFIFCLWNIEWFVFYQH